MSLHWGGKHGLFGAVSVILTIKLVVKKGLFLIDDLITHQLIHLPIEILLIELPGSLFGSVGGVVVRLTGSDLPAEGIGLVLVYPAIVALITLVWEGPEPRLIAAYWTSATVVTAFAVGAGVGLVVDPAGVGSGLAYHLQNHTLARLVRNGIVLFGLVIAETTAALTGIEMDESVGLAAFAGVAFAFGVVWEETIGHR